MPSSPEKLHVVSFNIPYPPDYGGIIDVYYKLRALKKEGVAVILHTFQYDRQPAAELEMLCEKVYYYPRQTGRWIQMSLQPYIVKSRADKSLLKNLATDEHPILFEGLHTCAFLDHPQLAGKKKIYRESNIEHQYYRGLSASTKSIWRKIYFWIEAIRLRNFQKILSKADLILPVSTTDEGYLKRKFPEIRIAYLPSFHGMNKATSAPGSGDYYLFHGNLSVPENEEAALWLIKNVFGKLPEQSIIAGKNPGKILLDETLRHPNILLIANPDQDEMNRLIREAQVNVLVTLRPAGLKLKLVNALYKGRFCIANHHMLKGSGLERACMVAHSSADIKKALSKLKGNIWNEAMTADRNGQLKAFHDDEKIRRMLELIGEC